MKYLYLLFVVLLVVATPVHAESLTPAKKMAIKELLDATGADDVVISLARMNIQQMINREKKKKDWPGDKMAEIIEQETLDVFREEFVSGSFYEMLYPVYHKYFTISEVKQLTKFYQSKVGRKFVKAIHQMNQDTYRVGREWGEKLRPELTKRFARRMKQEGL